MKQIVRYKFLTIPRKLNGELRLTIDKSVAYSSIYEGGKSTNISMLPSVVLSIMREQERGDDGRFVRPPWNPNDTIPLTRYHVPLLLQEMKSLYKDMQIPEMYKYTGERLELNETLAAKSRKVFVIGSVTVELVPVVIQRDATTSIEGIKMKFNNETSTVVLTLNEFYSTIYQLDKLDIDGLATWMFDRYIDAESREPFQRVARKKPVTAVVDIEPKTRIDPMLGLEEKSKTISAFDDL